MDVITVLRWYVNRMFDPGVAGPEGEQRIEFTVTPESADGVPRNLKTRPEVLAVDIERDDLAWWNADEASELDGFVVYEDFYSAFTRCHISQDMLKATRNIDKRKICEGMVFLQLIPGSSTDKLMREWEDCTSGKGIPDITGLVMMEGARWMDFTAQSRKMSSEIYREVLGEPEEAGRA